MNYQNIILIGGIEVHVDMDARQTPCKKCRKMIRFGVTKNSRLMPIIKIGDEWKSHFADCQFANDFRRTTIDRRIEDIERNERFLSDL